jgi:hypothetical protein
MKQGHTHTESNLNIVTLRLKVETLEPERRPLLESCSVNTTSPLQWWRHATIRTAAESGVATRSVTRRTVPLQWNMWYHTTHINRGTVFSVGSVQRLYPENKNKPVSLSRERRQKSTERLQVETRPSMRLLRDSRPWYRRGMRRSPRCSQRRVSCEPAVTMQQPVKTRKWL